MAERLKDKAPVVWNVGRRGKYPWNLWLDGGVWRLRRNKDFMARTVYTFRALVYITASRRGGKARISMPNEDELIIQFYKE